MVFFSEKLLEEKAVKVKFGESRPEVDKNMQIYFSHY
jgi:hypothetical protein